jgi:hypothetical protein
VTFLSVFATVLYWLPGQIQEKSVVQTIMMIRLLRLVRLVMAVNAFAVIGDTVTEIIPVCSRMFMVLFCITYLFAVTAVNTLGGAVSIDPAAPSFPALMASDYGTSNFYANNFNDMLGSFVVLFELLVVNNWTVTCDGYEIVTGERARVWGRVMCERALGGACEGFYGRGGDRAKRGSGGGSGGLPPTRNERTT